jgi:hypothetical protein
MSAPVTALGVCASCDDIWPADELGLDANLDPQCPDCRITGWGIAEADGAAFRLYSYGR